MNAIIGRTALTLSVLAQLGPNYQTLPGYASADYQAQADTLKANVDALQVHLDAILPLLKSIDADAGALDGKNKGLLCALQGLLKGWAQAAQGEQKRDRSRVTASVYKKAAQMCGLFCGLRPLSSAAYVSPKMRRSIIRRKSS